MLETNPCCGNRRLGRLALGDIAPGADHLIRLTALVIDEAQLVPDPAIGAVLLQKPVLESMVARFEQLTELALDPRQIFGVDVAAPEVRAVEIVALLEAQPVRDVLADEGRSKIPRCLEAVDHRRRGGEQLLDMGTGRSDGLLGRLALGDVAPGADHLVRFAALVTDEAQLVADPAIVAVLLQEPVLESVMAGREELAELALDPRQVVGMDAAAPKIRAVEIVTLLIPQPDLDVLADE